MSVDYTLSLLNKEPTMLSLVGAFVSDASGLGLVTDHKAKIQDSFSHSLQTFESYVQSLTHYNAATDESLVILDNHIHILSYLIGEELHEVSREIGELLGQLWTRLGANRSRLTNAHLRFESLTRAGHQTKAMKSFVWDVRVELDGLQESAEALRSYVAEPLLLGGSLPRVEIARALSDGCKLLRSRMAGGLTDATSRISVATQV